MFKNQPLCINLLFRNNNKLHFNSWRIKIIKTRLTIGNITHHSCRWVDTIHINPRNKLSTRWIIRISLTALNFNGIHSIFVRRSRRANDHPHPMGESHIVVVLQAPADGTVADTFLTSLEFLKQSEVSRYHWYNRSTYMRINTHIPWKVLHKSI